MVDDALFLLVSFIYIILSIALSYGVSRIAPPVFSRKLLHILASLWIIIMVQGSAGIAARIAGPLLFIAVNGAYAWHREHRLDNGLVSFPVALLIITLLYSYDRVSAATAVSSMLVLGFGDGIAAVAGYFLHKTKKSIEGSIAMFLISFLVLLRFSSLSLPLCLLPAIAATIAERATPSGLDNLTVPLTTALILEVICLFQ